MLIRSDDIQLSYEIRGSGFPIVLLHPFPVNHEFWIPVANRLSTRYQLILPDLRAHGQSGVGSATATMQKHADDLLRLIDAQQIARAVFVGASIGGYILFEFWRRYRERVAGLVFSNTRAEPDTEQGRANRLKSIEDSRDRGTAPFLDSQMSNWIGETTRRNRPDIVTTARALMQGLTVDALIALQQGMGGRPDSVPTLPGINVPTLITVGAEDTLTPATNAQLMHQRISGARLTVIPNTGHYAPLEDPEEYSRILRQFLDSLELGR